MYFFIPGVMRGSTGGGGARGAGVADPLKYHKHIGILSNTGPDPLKNHKATKPSINVGPSSARPKRHLHVNGVSLAGR